MFTFKGTNWQSKCESMLFMLIGAVLANVPAIGDWLTQNTHLSSSTITTIVIILSYIAKAWVMQPTPTLSDKQ